MQNFRHSIIMDPYALLVPAEVDQMKKEYATLSDNVLIHQHFETK